VENSNIHRHSLVIYSAKSAVVSANNAYYSMQSAEYVANQKFMNDAVARTLATDDPTYIEEDDAWLAAQASFLNQQTTLSQANISLNNAAINLQLSSPTITAPYTGTISNINLVSGMVIANSSSTSSSGTSTVSSSRVAVITNDATPIINVTLGETDVPNVKIGQKATVTFDSITSETFTGVVATVDRIGTISSNVTSYGVNIKLDSGSNQILPNMAATADIIIDTATDALYVPSAALVTQNGTTYAKTLVGGKEVDVTVETGISDDTNTVITSGLTEGETVITGTVTSSTAAKSTGTSVFSSSLRGIGGGGGAAVVRTSGGATGRGN
jgi:macrolide-specific efflux system membrane fusion protein